jgi:hypothetical protein
MPFIIQLAGVSPGCTRPIHQSVDNISLELVLQTQTQQEVTPQQPASYAFNLRAEHNNLHPLTISATDMHQIDDSGRVMRNTNEAQNIHLAHTAHT